MYSTFLALWVIFAFLIAVLIDAVLVIKNRHYDSYLLDDLVHIIAWIFAPVMIIIYTITGLFFSRLYENFKMIIDVLFRR